MTFLQYSVWISFSTYAYYFGLLALIKSVISGLSFAIVRAKYARPSRQENKNPDNLKVTVLKQVSKTLFLTKFRKIKFLSCTGIATCNRWSKLSVYNSSSSNLHSHHNKTVIFTWIMISTTLKHQSNLIVIPWKLNYSSELTWLIERQRYTHLMKFPRFSQLTYLLHQQLRVFLQN